MLNTEDNAYEAIKTSSFVYTWEYRQTTTAHGLLLFYEGPYCPGEVDGRAHEKGV
jgi:hypothetical protein